MRFERSACAFRECAFRVELRAGCLLMRVRVLMLTEDKQYWRYGQVDGQELCVTKVNQC